LFGDFCFNPDKINGKVAAWRVSGKLVIVSVSTQILTKNTSFHYSAGALAETITSFPDTLQAATKKKGKEKCQT